MHLERIKCSRVSVCASNAYLALHNLRWKDVCNYMAVLPEIREGKMIAIYFRWASLPTVII